MPGRGKRTSILLEKKQIDFLESLCKRIEEKGQMKMSHCQIIKVLTKTLACIRKPDIRECRNEEEIEKELVRCLKKGVKQLKK